MNLLSFLDQENIVAEFRDLIDSNSDEAETIDTGIDKSDVIDIHKPNASGLTAVDVKAELHRRGLQPKGFYSDDVEILQRCFNDEHEGSIETKRKELMNKRIEEVKQARVHRERVLIHNMIIEEKETISNDPRLSEWFRMVVEKSCPLVCRIDGLNNISARSLSKVLWADNRIKSLDISKLKLSDKAGAYVARALRSNTSLIKLEMDENKFGPETCKVLAESLSVNSTLQSLSIASNPFDKCQDSVALLATALAINSGLVSLSLWQCGIGLEGGKAVCDAVSKNTSLISVEIGYNNFDHYDVIEMTTKLEANRRARELRLSREAESERDRERAAQDKEKGEREKDKDCQNRRWLEQQQTQRAQTRQVELERRRAEVQKEERMRQQMEHALKWEEERAKTASKKGKKGEKAKKGEKGKSQTSG
ncbi:hypothetical protein ACHAW5_001672 [Stephanodiscus triporus]|uniref:Uncharacterized protein n=1 Tax=Stephanodiscus triporus TaxID=2934178 RepID=A0ABD3NEE1_9STRA